MNKNSEPTTETTRPITSFWVLGARLTWVFVGPVALLGLTYSIASQGGGWLTRLDAAFGVLAGLMLFGRWVEQRSGTATTLTGEPATPQHYRVWMMVVLPAIVGLWIIANVLGNYVLK